MEYDFRVFRDANEIGGMGVLCSPLTPPDPALSPLSRRRGGERKVDAPKGWRRYASIVLHRRQMEQKNGRERKNDDETNV